MSSNAAARQATPAHPPSFPRSLIAIAAGLALFVLGLLAIMIVYDAANTGKIYPGVSVAGIDLSGQTQEQAARLIVEQITFPQTGKIVLQDGDRLWLAKPADLGLFLDANSTAQAAYHLGRQGDSASLFSAVGVWFDKFGAWYTGRQLSPQLIYDERVAQRYLTALSAQIDQPVVEASLVISGIQVNASAGQVGRALDIPAALTALKAPINSLTDGLIPLTVNEKLPFILDASQAAETARQILSQPLVLKVSNPEEGDPGPWSVPPEKLAEMLVIGREETPVGGRYIVNLNAEPLRALLEGELAGKLARTPANARFTFNDETRQLEVIQPAVIGRSLDVAATIQAVDQQLLQGQHELALNLVYTPPEIGNEVTAEQLGITGLVSEQRSFFRGSSKERVQNIQTAAGRFHGLLVPPGATFSMAESMGDVSLDSGYAEALIIFGGRTIKGVGGGVCQVSTTLFRTALFGGFPIVERTPHAYRVGYYEQDAGGWDINLAGMDATVFVPLVDFKFTNDTPYWLLMETYVNRKAQTLTWKFYSTSDGRTVDVQSSGPQNIVEPPEPLYEENPALAPGEIKQVDWAAQGSDVSVTRTVYRDGQVLFTDTINTHYMPWQDIFQYGPGTNIPGVTDKKNDNG